MISLSDAVFDTIESKILTGEYAVGTILTENALSKSLSVSRTPIREAIKRLEQEDLVKETSKGHVVVGVTKKDIVDIYEIRSKLEGEATARCAENISDEALKRLEEIIELQEFYTARGEAEKIKSVDSEFHLIIYNNCGSAVYASILSALHNKVQLFRKQSVSVGARAQKAAEEHRGILGALKKRDAALAEGLALKHIENAKKNLTGEK